MIQIDKSKLQVMEQLEISQYATTNPVHDMYMVTEEFSYKYKRGTFPKPELITACSHDSGLSPMNNSSSYSMPVEKEINKLKKDKPNGQT